MADKQIQPEKSKSRIGETFNFFVSLEVKNDPDHRTFISQVEEFQEKTLSMFPEMQAKPAKLQSLHITLATLLVREDEMPVVIQSIEDAVAQFSRVYSGEDGIRCDFQGVSTYRDIVFLEMALGANAFKTFKDILLINGLNKFLTDQCQSPHLTYLRKLDLNDVEKKALMTMMSEIKTSRITLDTLSLRERKMTGEPLRPPVKQFNLWRE